MNAIREPSFSIAKTGHIPTRLTGRLMPVYPNQNLMAAGGRGLAPVKQRLVQCGVNFDILK